jgi:hypothetical protein
MVESKDWTYKQALERVTKRLDNTGIPFPAPPKNYGKEYAYPEDVTELSSSNLAQLMSKLMAWAGYGRRLLAWSEADLNLLETAYDIALGAKMYGITMTAAKKELKDIVRAQALVDEPTLLSAARSIAEKQTIARLLKAQVEIYQNHFDALSREQTRRSDELRGNR